MSEYAPGTQIPGTQYRVLRLLGSGGHGSVYAVHHVFLDAPFVLKILHGEHAVEKDLTQRMMREARTLAKLRHPNIVEVHDGGMTAESPPRPFFVMESLSGLPLRALFREVRGGVGVMSALRIMIGILSGLHYAHVAGVVHRDIKPDNIFLHKSGADVTVPKVLDFGIAHLLLGRRLTGRMFLGTPRYASPEQLRGGEVSAKTDIYAAGLLFFELLTGETPFAQHRDMGSIAAAHLNESLPKPSSYSAEIPAELDELVAKMTAKDPEARPATAFAAEQALREVRGVLEATRSRSIHAADYKTDPTPMENFLTEASPDQNVVVTEVGGSPLSGNANDTIRDPVALFETVRDPSRHPDPALSATEPSPRPPPGPGARGFDRNARTNTAKGPRAHATEKMSPESLARGLLAALGDPAPVPDHNAAATPGPVVTDAGANWNEAAKSVRSAPLSAGTRSRIVASAIAGTLVAAGIAAAVIILVRSNQRTTASRNAPTAAAASASAASAPPPSSSIAPPSSAPGPLIEPATDAPAGAASAATTTRASAEAAATPPHAHASNPLAAPQAAGSATVRRAAPQPSSSTKFAPPERSLDPSSVGFE